HRAPVFIGKNADPGPCNNQESGDDNCSGAYCLPQTALIDGNVGTGQRNDHPRGHGEGYSLCQVCCTQDNTGTQSQPCIGYPFVGKKPAGPAQEEPGKERGGGKDATRPGYTKKRVYQGADHNSSAGQWDCP